MEPPAKKITFNCNKLTAFMRNVLGMAFLFLFGTIRAQLPSSGLVAYYPFNVSAQDASSNKNDGQLNGAIAPAADRFGNPCGAFRFIGTGCYVSVPNSVSLKAPVSALTITAWVKPERGNGSTGDFNLILLAKPGIEAGADIKPQYCFQIKRVFGDSYSTISLSNDFSFQDKQYNAHPMEFNQWYFIAVTYDENFVQVYQDGKLICQAPKNKPFLANDFALEIGRDIVAGKKYFNGCLDDLRIYNRGLSAAEVNLLFNDQAGKILKEDVELNYQKSLEKNTEPGKCYATVFYAEPMASVGCGSVVLKQKEGLPSGSKFEVGVNNLVYETKLGERELIDSFQITVKDKEAPVFKCPTDIITQARANTNGVEVRYPGLSVSDNCPNVKLEMAEGLPTGSIFPIGVTTLKYKATDASGNKSECSFKITVTNEQVPVNEAAKPVAEKVVKPEEKKLVKAEEPAKDVATTPAKPLKNLYITCPGNMVGKMESGHCGGTVNYTAPQVPLGGGVVVVQTKGQRSGTLFPCGTTTNTFTATDAANVVKECSFNVTIKDNEAPVFDCPKDSVILLPPKRKGLVYHYKPPLVRDNCGVDSVAMVAGPKDGCFLQLGVHPFIFKAFDKAGNAQTCTYSIIVKEDANAPPVAQEIPKKLDAQLELGGDSVHYEHNASVGNCELTLLIYDDGEEDNDSVSIIFNNEVIVNRDMIRLKENGAFKRNISLIAGEQNYVIAKAWNTGRYGLNTLRIDVFEGSMEGEKKDSKFKKPVISKVLHSRPGDAGGLLLKCN